LEGPNRGPHWAYEQLGCERDTATDLGQKVNSSPLGRPLTSPGLSRHANTVEKRGYSQDVTSMEHSSHTPVLLSQVAPKFAHELREALMRQGDDPLSDQVSALRVFSVCGCGDDFCQSFYTGPRAEKTWADLGGHHNVQAEEMEGMVVLDVVDEQIRYVEVLDYPRDLLTELNRALKSAAGRAEEPSS
jgi:hypothetical protein